MFKDSDSEEAISMVDNNFISYMFFDRFFPSATSDSVFSCLNGIFLENKSWTEIKSLVDNVHKHVCGYATFTDFKLLLQHSRLWNEAVEANLSQLMER